jgi:hypothetical protein
MLNNIAAIIGGVTPEVGDYESIATVNGNGSASTLSFTAIAGTYKHLQIRGIARNGRATTVDTAYFTINSDTGSNYAYHYMQGNGSSALAGGEFSKLPNNTSAFVAPGSSASANMFSAVVVDLLDYSSTNKTKTIRTLSGTDQNGSGNVWLDSVLWNNASNAITQIDITTGTGSAWSTYTTFALYGIK